MINLELFFGFLLILAIGVAVTTFVSYLFRRKSYYNFERIPRAQYAKYHFLPSRLEHPIYVFLDNCVDSFNLIPDKVHKLPNGYVCLWRASFGHSNPAGSETYITVIVVKTSDKQLFGHIRSPILFESGKSSQPLENNYFYTPTSSPQSKNKGFYISDFYYNKIKLVTEDFTRNDWNFVFYEGWLAIYKRSTILDEDEVLRFSSLFSI